MATVGEEPTQVLPETTIPTGGGAVLGGTDGPGSVLLPTSQLIHPTSASAVAAVATQLLAAPSSSTTPSPHPTPTPTTTTTAAPLAGGLPTATPSTPLAAGTNGNVLATPGTPTSVSGNVVVDTNSPGGTGLSDQSAAGRGRGRPTKPKGVCTRAECNEPEMCTGLCRRCYHQEYNQRKKTSPHEGESGHDLSDSRERAIKRQRRKSVGPFTTADGVVIDTPYIVEVSVNARTKCQVCKDRISRDELRIGVLRSKAPGQCRWYHPQCFQPGYDFSLRRLHGRKQLNSTDRANLKHILSSPKKHKHRHRDRDRRSRSRSSSSELSNGSSSSSSSKSSKKKHKSSSKDKKHKGHKKEVHVPQPPVYQHDSSDSASSYSEDVEDFEEEEGEEGSYDSEDSSQGSSHSDDGDYDYHR